MQLATEQRVTLERERELLRNETDFFSLKQKSASYKKTLQAESLEGLPEYMQWAYRLTDYLGITIPDKRLQEKLKLSEASCVRQRMLVQQYESRIKEQERFVLEKEQELEDCQFCYEKRRAQLAENESQAKALQDEKIGYSQILKQDGNNKEAAEMVSRASAQLFELKHKQRVVEREKNEFASRIVECDSAIAESENTLVALGIYSSTLQKSYVRSRIEIMRLKPLLSSSNSPVETIDRLVEDKRMSEQTERLADTMSKWVYEITCDISEEIG